MRKLFEKLCLALFVPVILFVFFFTYEPYDYWSVKGWTIYSAKPIVGMRELKLRGDADYILLGDSRMANLNVDMVSEAAGVEYVSLAFGGCTLSESAEQLRYVVEDLRLTPKKVVVGLNFYTASPNHSADRIYETENKINNAKDFLSVRDYWYHAFRQLEVEISEEAADITGNENIKRVLEDPSDPNQNTQPTVTEYLHGYRVDILAYADTIISQIGDYGDISVTLDLLDWMINECQSVGSEIEFVLWPCNRCMYDKVIDPRGFQYEIYMYKNLISSKAKVYDMEWQSELSENDDMFMDGFHLVSDAKREIIEAVFGGVEKPWCIVTTP